VDQTGSGEGNISGFCNTIIDCRIPKQHDILEHFSVGIWSSPSAQKL
jgi:hypothetical protein